MTADIDRYLPELDQATTLSGALFVLLAFAFLHLWRRARDEGLEWIAGSLLSYGLWNLTIPLHPNKTVVYVTELVDPYRLNLLVPLVPILLSVGVVKFIGLPRRTSRWLLPLLVVPNLAILLVTAAHLQMSRLWFNVGITYALVLLAIAAWQAGGREPGQGHRPLALALATMPAMAVSMLALGRETVRLRDLLPYPAMATFLAILLIALLRRQVKLEREIRKRIESEQQVQQLNATLERKVEQRTADLQHLVEGLEAFNKHLSHDLKGPLGGIMGLARLARTPEILRDKVRLDQYLSCIETQAESSTELVYSLLELARASDTTLSLQPVPLGELVEQVLGALQREGAGQPWPAVTFEPLPVWPIDRALLSTALTNLLSNAVRFARRSRPPAVAVRCDATPSRVRIRIEDNGPGIPADRLDQLFKPFVRLHVGDQVGHGLGLTIVQRAVTRHGGKVWAESAEGKGAAFTIELPAA